MFIFRRLIIMHAYRLKTFLIDKMWCFVKKLYICHCNLLFSQKNEFKSLSTFAIN